jgi:hypothetical protein
MIKITRNVDYQFPPVPETDNNLLNLCPEISINQIDDLIKQPRYKAYVVLPKEHDSSRQAFGPLYVTGQESPLDYVLMEVNLTDTERTYIQGRGYQVFLLEDPKSLFVTYKDLNFFQHRIVSYPSYDNFNYNNTLYFFGYSIKPTASYTFEERSILKKFLATLFNSESIYNANCIKLTLISNPYYAILSDYDIPPDIENQLFCSGIFDVIILSNQNKGKSALFRKLKQLTIAKSGQSSISLERHKANFLGEQYYYIPNINIYKLKIRRIRKKKNNNRRGFACTLTQYYQTKIFYHLFRELYSLNANSPSFRIAFDKLKRIILKQFTQLSKAIERLSIEDKSRNMKSMHIYLRLYRTAVSNILRDPIPHKNEVLQFIKEMVVYILYSIHFYRITYEYYDRGRNVPISHSRIFKLSSLKNHLNHLPVLCMSHLIIIHSLFKTTNYFINSLLMQHSYDEEFCNKLARIKNILNKYEIGPAEDVKKFIAFYKNKLSLLRNR